MIGHLGDFQRAGPVDLFVLGAEEQEEVTFFSGRGKRGTVNESSFLSVSFDPRETSTIEYVVLPADFSVGVFPSTHFTSTAASA